MQWLLLLFGQGRDLNAAQMCARAIVLFTLTVWMMRISGRRSLGQRNPYDSVVPVLLGAVVSRAVVGASPFVPTVLAGLTIVLVHRATGLLSLSFPAFERLINGSERIVSRDGRIDPVQLRKGLLTEHDLIESARMHGRADLSGADLTFERNGQISLVRRAEAADYRLRYVGNRVEPTDPMSGVPPNGTAPAEHAQRSRV